MTRYYRNFAVFTLAVALMSTRVDGADDTQAVQDDTQAVQDDTQAVEEDVWALVNEASDGYRLGEFLLKPEIAVSGVYDSNIFATRNDEEDDEILVFSPELDISSEWERHKLDLDLGGAFGRYFTNHDEDYKDYWANLDGRYDIDDASNIFGGFGYSFEHEDRGSPEDAQSGSEPTTFASIRTHAGVSHGWGKVSLRLGGTYEMLDYDDAGTLTNQDRDRDLIGAGARLNYLVNPQYTVYGQGVWDLRDYDERTDDNGFQRDSDGYRAGLGVQATVSNRLKGELYLGYLRHEYDDPRFSDISEADFGGSLKWLATPSMTLSSELERSLEETTLDGSSGYLYTSLSGNLLHTFSPRMNMNAGISLAEADYQDVDRRDNYYSARIGMRYYIVPGYYLGAEYRFLIRDSDNPADPQGLDDYRRNQFFLTLGTSLFPVKSGAYRDMP